MAVSCQVCESQPPKYKCPSCQLRYCSIDCYKQHKLAHTQSQAPLLAAPFELPKSSDLLPASDSTKQKDYKHLQDSYTTLLKSTELQQLFARYPLLKSQLKSSYLATMEPSQEAQERLATRGGRRDRGRGNARGRRNTQHREAPWTKERALRQALNIFKQSRTAQGQHGEGLREFTALVAKIRDESAVRKHAGQPQDLRKNGQMALA